MSASAHGQSNRSGIKSDAMIESNNEESSLRFETRQNTALDAMRRPRDERMGGGIVKLVRAASKDRVSSMFLKQQEIQIAKQRSSGGLSGNVHSKSSY